MKTLILATVSTAALLLAGAASAQSTVEQRYQSARDQLNNAAQAQSSPSENSYTYQKGDSNSVTVDQAVPSAKAAEYSTVIQGWGNGTSTGNSAAVTQRGVDDRSVVMQRNYPEGGGGGNSAIVGQSAGAKNAYTYQYGNGNSSSISQTGDADSGQTSSSVHTVADTGAGEAYTTEFHSVDGSAKHAVSDAGGRVIQDEAVGNSATLQQYGTGGNQKGTIVQWYAERNSAAIYQTGGSSNAALTYQTGHDSNASISQNGGSNQGAVFQVSGDADGAAYGAGDNGYNDSATVSQVGTSNLASALQGGNGNNSSISQNGMNNSAGSYQLGSGSYSTINQTSNNGNALVDQRGLNGSASVSQTATGDNAYVSQMGTGAYNYATVSQAAARALSVSYQNGSGNSVSVYQH